MVERQRFELLALLTEALRRLLVRPQRRAGLGEAWALPLPGVRRCGPLDTCAGQAPRPSTSASSSRAVRELLHLVRMELQPFRPLALRAVRPA